MSNVGVTVLNIYLICRFTMSLERISNIRAQCSDTKSPCHFVSGSVLVACCLAKFVKPRRILDRPFKDSAVGLLFLLLLLIRVQHRRCQMERHNSNVTFHFLTANFTTSGANGMHHNYTRRLGWPAFDWKKHPRGQNFRSDSESWRNPDSLYKFISHLVCL